MPNSFPRKYINLALTEYTKSHSLLNSINNTEHNFCRFINVTAQILKNIPNSNTRWRIYKSLSNEEQIGKLKRLFDNLFQVETLYSLEKIERTLDYNYLNINDVHYTDIQPDPL